MRSPLRAALLQVVLVLLAPAARAADGTAEDAQRWARITSAVYGERALRKGSDVVTVVAPDRALDAALVPVTVKLNSDKRIIELSLFVDNNPSPLVGVFHFGPAFEPSQIKTRVRVDAYSYIHAVAETDDGTLLTADHYIRAAGGCSSPSTGQNATIDALVGQMQLRRVRPAEGTAIASQLMISHPNYNGMQMSPGSPNLIPARYLERITVKTGGQTVFEMAASISLSEDPVVGFSYLPFGAGEVEVLATDSSGAAFHRRFDPLP